MNLKSWCKQYDALLIFHGVSTWEPMHDPMNSERYMGERLRRFWIPLAHAMHPNKRTFRTLEPTSRWVAEYELQCLHRWFARVTDRYGVESSLAQTWSSGLDACKILLDSYDGWVNGFAPPSDWESEFECLVEDLFCIEHLESTSNRPTMVDFWFEEFVRYWVPFRFDSCTACTEEKDDDPQRHLHVWKREIQSIHAWIERNVSFFTHPDIHCIQQTRESLRRWNEVYETMQKEVCAKTNGS